MKTKPWFNLFLKGLAIGTAAIIPGISGGTIAFMLGVYDQLIFAIVHFKQNMKQSMTLLIPIGLGAVAGIALLTVPMSLAFTYAPLPTVSLFAGFIIGSLPSLRKELPKKLSTKQWFIITLPALVAALLGVFSVIGRLDASAILINAEWMPKFVLIGVGFLGVSAFIVPGISGSMLLLAIGFYEPVLNSLRRLLEHITNWSLLFPELVNFTFLGFGALFGFLALSILMAYLLKHHRLSVNLGVFGFIVGSLVSIYMNYEIVTAYASLAWYQILLAGLTISLGAYTSNKLYQNYATR